jgi:epothilone synthetase B
MRADGEIEILGRIDNQLKIRGQRIEPGEVEEAIRKHPRVDQVTVQAIADPGAAKRLVAFVTAVRDSGEPGAACHWKLRVRHAALWEDSSAAHIDLPPAGTEEERRILAHARRSQRTFSPEPVTQVQLRDLLSCLLGHRSSDRLLPKFRYPSAGSLYPVRTFIDIGAGRVEGIPAGVYYYHPLEARLSLVSAEGVPACVHVEHNRCLVHEAAFTIYLIGHLPAIRPAYGEASRDFCLIEAGCISQLLMTEGTSAGLGLCPVGSVETAGLASALGLSDDDVFLHCLAGGKASAGQTWVDRMHVQLRSVLPEPLVPDHIVLLDQLPLTPNGKLDRQALAAAAANACNVLGDPAADMPSSTAEAGIARIAAEILGIERVPIRRKFFEIGFDSVQLVRMMTRIRAQAESLGLAREVEIPDLFAYPTVELLAGHLTACDRTADVAADVAADAARLRGRRRSAIQRQ